MVCIYHSRDLDGWMSAAIVKLKYPDVELLGWDYGNAIPDISFKEVIMVDVSFPKEIMRDNANRITWIDHHISAIKDVASLDPLPFIEGRRNDKFAACELTWQFFFPEEPMPELVRLLGRYDCFGHKGTEEEVKVLEFQYGARQLIYDVNTALINLHAAINLSDDVVCNDILKNGKAIYEYLCTEARQTYARKFDINFDTRGDKNRDWTKEDRTYKFGCVNEVRFNPINFGIDYHKDGYDGFACFHYQNGQWIYSLYNDNGNVDCSLLCKKRGGGGHRGAAGFQAKEPILK